MSILTTLYGAVERRLLGGIASRLTAGITSPSWQVERAAQTGTFRRWVDTVLGAAGRRASAAAGGVLRAAYRRGAPRASRATADARSAPARAMVDARIGATHTRAAGFAVDAYRSVVAAGWADDATARAVAVRTALGRATAQGITGFVDARGRRWKMPTYLETVVSNAAIELELTGTIDTLRGEGLASARVRSDGQPCERCRPWAGRVIFFAPGGPASLDTARAAGLFHPRCRCTLVRVRPR